MTFLAPWALAVGALASAGLVVLHLVARQRPAVYPLPTARFVPDRRTLVSRVSRRPRDLVLLLVRVLLVLGAAAAFARPVLAPSRARIARVVVLDRSSAVADAGEALQRMQEVTSDGAPTRLVVFDTTARAMDANSVTLDSLGRQAVSRCCTTGSLSAALIAARREGASLADAADSVELVIVSPLMEREMDAASAGVRGQWPGGARLVRVSAAVDSTDIPAVETRLSAADVLGPALLGRAVTASSRAVRVLRRAPNAADSAFARRGGVLVRWDSIGGRAIAPRAIAMGDDVVVASLARESIGGTGTVLARWADGTPAATEQALGAGCVREVAIGVPVAGDLPLRPVFQRIVRGLTDACAGSRRLAGAPLDSAAVRQLMGTSSAARGHALSGGDERPTPAVPWLLGVALVCALVELALRARQREEDPT
jgi:hypothetical protein